MALDTLPGVLKTFTRDQIVKNYLADFAIRAPVGTLTGVGSQAWIDALVFADSVQTLYADAVTIGNQTVLDSATGAFLDQLAAIEGISRAQPQGAAGTVVCTVSAAGGTVVAGDTLKDQKTGLTFQIKTNKNVLPTDTGAQIVGIDTGPATNAIAGTALTFTNPRPGIGPLALVDSSGLTGGSLAETDPQLINRIKLLKANRPASGNDSDYQVTTEATQNVNVEKAFTYPAIMGPGTIGVVFTVRPQSASGSRRPTRDQVANVQDHLSRTMPAQDGIFVGALLSQPVSLALRVSWAPGFTWSDVASPWPQSSYGLVATATDPLTFMLSLLSGSTYAGIPPPTPTANLAFFNPFTNIFVLKRILTVTGVGPWFVTCDPASSDREFTPLQLQAFGPWAPFLSDLVPPVKAFMATLGPGEQVTTFYDPGIRQKRSPPDPLVWPKDVSNRILPSLLAVPSVQDAAVLNLASLVCPVGVPGVASILVEMINLAVYAA